MVQKRKSVSKKNSNFVPEIKSYFIYKSFIKSKTNKFMKKIFTLIAAALLGMSANAQLATGDYFIKNVETGKFLNGANFWGTKASVTEHAQIMGVNANDGKYAIDSHYSNDNGRNFVGAGDNTYVDAAIAYHTIAAVEGGYSIMDANGKYLVSADGNIANFNGAEAQVWQFMTKADYIAEAVAKAKAGEKGDLTGLVPDANFSRNNQDINLWTGESKMGKGGPNNDKEPISATGMNVEKWGGNSKSIDFGTKVQGLPNGKYLFKFQSLYRYNNTTDNTNDVAAAAHADGTEKIIVNMIVNGVSVPFVSIADEASVEINGGVMPFSQAEAAQAFSKGAYQQELEVVVTDGTLSIQVVKNEEQHIGCDWALMDNIELYLVEAAEEAEYTVYAKVTAGEDGTKTFVGQNLKVSKLGGVATVTLPAATAGGFAMESQDVKVNINAEGEITMIEGQTLNFTAGATKILVTVTGVEGSLVDGKVKVFVTAKGDNGKDVNVIYSTDEIVPDPEITILTKEMFKTWTSAGADAQVAASQSSTSCDYVMNESTGMPYGNGNVDWMQYADLSEYDYLTVTASAGTPRFFLNRKTADGQAPSNAIDTNNATHFANYVTKVDNGDGTFAFTLNVAKIVEEQGFAHLNVIKGGNRANVTVTKMELVKNPTAVKAAKAAPVKAAKVAKFFKNGKVVIVKDGKMFNVAGAQM